MEDSYTISVDFLADVRDTSQEEEERKEILRQAWLEAISAYREY